MYDTCTSSKTFLRAGTCPPIYPPYPAVGRRKPNQLWRNLGEGSANEVGCAIVCADHGQCDSADEEGVGDGVDLEGRMVSDEEEPMAVSTPDLETCEGLGSLFIGTENGINLRHSAAHWLRDPPFLQGLGLGALAVGLGPWLVLGEQVGEGRVLL